MSGAVPFLEQRRRGLPGPRAQLVGVFLAHNLEEVLTLDGLRIRPQVLGALHLDAGWYRRDRFAAATVVLTGAVAALSASVDGRRGRRSAFLGTAAAGALVANAVGHLGRAAASRSYNPGAASAPVLLISALESIRRIRAIEALTARETATAAAVGAVASLPAIAGSLALARAVIR